MFKQKIKDEFKILKINMFKLFKWLLLSLAVGITGGVVGSLFHKSLDLAGEMRAEKPFLIALLPLAGVLIAFLYKVFQKNEKLDTNLVVEAAFKGKKVPLVLAPLIFISTFITQLFGGSAGREGAALQMGGSLGYNVGKCFKLNKEDLKIIVMAGMSSVFTALFSAPVTAAVLSLEVSVVGVMNFFGLFPCLIASVTSNVVARFLMVEPYAFPVVKSIPLTLDILIKIAVLALLCAVVSIIFCLAIRKCEKYMKRFIKNVYLKAFVGGLVIVFLTFVLKTTDYNGAGMEMVIKAISGQAKPEAFILKIVFTAICIAAGFKGGEIVPALFVGSTFGCVAGQVLGMDAGLGAQLGMICLFCGVLNCPLSALILAIEFFGAENILPFALAVGVCFFMSGHIGLYKSQKFLFSKTDNNELEINNMLGEL